MKTNMVELHSSYSQESMAAEMELKKNNILFERYLGDSYTAPPVLYDPEGRFPYVGLIDIKKFIRIAVELGLYQKIQNKEVSV